MVRRHISVLRVASSKLCCDSLKKSSYSSNQVIMANTNGSKHLVTRERCYFFLILDFFFGISPGNNTLLFVLSLSFLLLFSASRPKFLTGMVFMRCNQYMPSRVTRHSGCSAQVKSAKDGRKIGEYPFFLSRIRSFCSFHSLEGQELQKKKDGRRRQKKNT